MLRTAIHQRTGARPAIGLWSARRDWLWFVPVVVAALVFRIPPILNAQAMSSDATIVGLQAQHILRGEWSRFLWGAGYQSSLDAWIAAAVFAVVGANQWTLMLVPLIGHVVLLACAFAILRRRLGASMACVLCLALAWTPRAINSVTVYPPRQWSISAMFVAVWCLDRASSRPRAPLWLAAGAFLSIMSLYLDLFSLQMMPGVALFGLLCCLDPLPANRRPSPTTVFQRSLGYAAGFGAGALAFVWLRQGPESTSHTATLTLDRIGPNLALLWDTCLPWLLGVKVYLERNIVWDAPTLFYVVQIVGATSAVAGVVAGGLMFFWNRVPWSLRRLGVLGAVVAVCSLGGFAVSTMPADQYSSRYLAPIVWMLPFAVAPVAFALGKRRFPAAFAPYLLAAVVSGWLSFSPFVQGFTPVLAPRGAAIGESAVRELLQTRNIRYAAADYWLAYRLTFMWNEQTIVVPLRAGQDRYPPYRAAFDAAPVVAYIFHPSQPQANPDTTATQLRQAGVAYERIALEDDFTVLVATRP